MIKSIIARASAAIDNQRRNSSSDESRWRVQISGILGHGKRRYESNQGSGQARDRCSTWPDQMPSFHTRGSNGIVHKQRYGSPPLLSGTHWVVWEWIDDVKRLCVQAYKNAWHLPRSTTSALFIFPKTHVGTESTLPMAVLTQELLLHAERCMRHEDVSKRIMLAGLNRTLDEWLWDSFAELLQNNGTVEAGWRRGNQRLLVETSKSTAAEQQLSHVGRAVGQQTGINTYHWKTELGCSN